MSSKASVPDKSSSAPSASSPPTSDGSASSSNNASNVSTKNPTVPTATQEEPNQVLSAAELEAKNLQAEYEGKYLTHTAWWEGLQKQWMELTQLFELAKFDMHNFMWADKDNTEPTMHTWTFAQQLKRFQNDLDHENLIYYLDWLKEKLPKHPAVHEWPAYKLIHCLLGSYDNITWPAKAQPPEAK